MKCWNRLASTTLIMFYFLLFTLFSLFCRSVTAVFGVKQAATSFLIDTGSGLTYEVDKCVSQSNVLDKDWPGRAGILAISPHYYTVERSTRLLWKDRRLTQAWGESDASCEVSITDTVRSASSVSTRNVGPDYVVTTIKSNGNPVTQYYVAKKGESRIVSTVKSLLNHHTDCVYSISLRISQVRFWSLRS